MHPQLGGLTSWQRVLRNVSRREQTSGFPAAAVNYRTIRPAAGWAMLLLDATDGLPMDTDGHGHIGMAQLVWL